MNAINNIPGCFIFTAGAALIGSTAYLLYNYFKSSSQPQSHEGNIKARRRRILRKLGKKDPVINATEHSYDCTNRDIERMVRHAYVYLQMEVQTGDNIWVNAHLSGMAFNVTSNIFIMPYHYWYRFDYCNKLYSEQKLVSRLRVSWSAKEQSCIYFDSIHVLHFKYDHAADIVYMRFKNFNCGRDLRKFIVSEDDEPNLVTSYLYGYRPRGEPDFAQTEILQVGKVSSVEMKYKTSEKNDVITGEIIPSEEIYYKYCFQYDDCLTGPGDCSMLLMHSDSRVMPKIYGIHTAGNQYLHTGISAPLYREDIEEAIEHFGKTERVISLEVDTTYIDLQSDLSETANVYQEEGFNVVGNTSVINVNGKNRRIRASIPSKKQSTTICST